MQASSRSPILPAPSDSRRPRRRARLLALVAIGSLALAACTPPDNTPTEYGDVVQANFLASCTGNVPLETGTTVIATPSYCQCAYDWYVANVPYDDSDLEQRFPGYQGPTFKQLESDLKGDPNALPAQIQDGLKTCQQSETIGPTPGTTPGSTPGTTVAGDDGGTTSTTGPVGPVAPTTTS